MTAKPPVRYSDSQNEAAPSSSVGLRFRIWMGCLGGAVVTGAGIWWVLGVHAGPGTTLDAPLLLSWLVAVASLGILVGAAMALWLDHGIVGSLRSLVSGVTTGRVSELRGIAAASGWGELSQLTQQTQLLLTHHRQAIRAAEELGLVRQQLGSIHEALERWSTSERWEESRIESGPLVPVLGALDRGFRRWDEVRDQNLEAARQIEGEVDGALDDARESAEQAERGFVEVTALLTTIRELQRLGAELEQALASAGSDRDRSAAQRELLDAARDAARAAIEELIEASAGSVDLLAGGLARVQEIADQVHIVANRATVIALNATLMQARDAGARDAASEPGEDLAPEMKRLATEVRVATERTHVLSQEVEREIAAAVERMRGVRQRVAARLDQIPAPAAARDPASRVSDDVLRLLERVREMIQDATQKGERLSAAGERASRAADRLVRRLDDEVAEMAGLVARMAPSGMGQTAAHPKPTALPADALRSPGDATPDAHATTGDESGTRLPGLRLLGQEHVSPGDAPRPRERTSGHGEERS